MKNEIKLTDLIYEEIVFSREFISFFIIKYLKIF